MANASAAPGTSRVSKAIAGQVPAPNKGMRLSAEVLAPGEVKALLESFGRSTAGVRNRAMVTLIHRASLKMSALIALERRQYDRRKGTLTVAVSRNQPE